MRVYSYRVQTHQDLLLFCKYRWKVWRYTILCLLITLAACVEVPEEEKVVPPPPPRPVPPPVARGLYEDITLDQITFYNHVKDRLPSVLTTNPDPSIEYEIPASEAVVSGVLDVNHTPVADENFDAGDGSPDNPYLISRLDQLKSIYTHRQAHYVLTQDIVVEEMDEPLEALGAGPNQPFVGVFDGKGNSIIGLTITAPTSDIGLHGLFQSVGVRLRTKEDATKIVNFGTIKNLILRNTTINITGREMLDSTIGLLVGSLQGIVINCHVINGTVTAGASSSSHSVGGLVGRANSGSQVVFCSSSAIVSGQGTNGTGGLVGNADGGLISYSFATGDVRGETNVGGLVGILSYKLWDCFASNQVLGDAENVGGLIGNVQGGALIENTYASSRSIIGTENVGGLIGIWNSTQVNIHRNQSTLLRNSYSIAKPRSEGVNVGGVLGINPNPAHNGPEETWIIENVYWNTDTTAVYGNLGREDGQGGVPFGRTTTEIACPTQSNVSCTSQQIYINWSESSWDFGKTNERPLLRFENVRQDQRVF